MTDFYLQLPFQHQLRIYQLIFLFRLIWILDMSLSGRESNNLISFGFMFIPTLNAVLGALTVRYNKNFFKLCAAYLFRAR